MTIFFIILTCCLLSFNTFDYSMYFIALGKGVAHLPKILNKKQVIKSYNVAMCQLTNTKMSDINYNFYIY